MKGLSGSGIMEPRSFNGRYENASWIAPCRSSLLYDERIFSKIFRKASGSRAYVDGIATDVGAVRVWPAVFKHLAEIVQSLQDSRLACAVLAEQQGNWTYRD